RPAAWCWSNWNAATAGHSPTTGSLSASPSSSTSAWTSPPRRGARKPCCPRRGSEHPGERVRRAGKVEGRGSNEIEPRQEGAAMEHPAACGYGDILPVSERGAAAFLLRTLSWIRVRRATEWDREAGTCSRPRGRSSSGPHFSNSARVISRLGPSLQQGA